MLAWVRQSGPVRPNSLECSARSVSHPDLCPPSLAQPAHAAFALAHALCARRSMTQVVPPARSAPIGIMI